MVSMMPPPPPLPPSSKDLDTTPVTEDGEAVNMGMNVNISANVNNMSEHALLMSHANLNSRRRSMQAQLQRTHARAAAPGELPDYIKKAWGVTPTLLTDNLPSVMALFYCVLDLRLTIGNGFIASMARARSGMRGDVWNTANIVPKPRSAKYGVLDYSVLAQTAVDPMRPSAFSDGYVPEMSLTTYATRFFEVTPVQARLSPAVYILVLIYLDRAFQRNSNMFLNSFNAHRIVLGAFVVAVKYHEDEYVAQHIFAHNGGVSLDEINHLEVEFLKAIDHGCFVSHADFEQHQVDLMMECIEANPASHIIGILRMNNIAGLDDAIQQVSINNAGGDEEKFSKTEKNLLVRDNTKALLRQMFPGMPVDGSTQNPTRKQWTMWQLLSEEMSPEQEYIYQMLLNIVIELDQATRPTTIGSYAYNPCSNSHGYQYVHGSRDGYRDSNPTQHANLIGNARRHTYGYAQGHGHGMRISASYGHRSASVGIDDANAVVNTGGDGNLMDASYGLTSTFNDAYQNLANEMGSDGRGNAKIYDGYKSCTSTGNATQQRPSQVREAWPKVQLPPVKSVSKATRSNNNGHIGGHLNNSARNDPWTMCTGNYNRTAHNRTAQQNRRPAHDPADHSTTIAKSAVSFILNDMDPFADLQQRNAYNRFNAAQQQQPLRMQW